MCQIWSKLVQRFGQLCGLHIHIHYIYTYKQTHAQTVFSYNKDVCGCVYSLWFCGLYRLWLLVPWLAQQSYLCLHTPAGTSASCAELCDVGCGLCKILLAQFSVYKRTDPVFFVCSVFYWVIVRYLQSNYNLNYTTGKSFFYHCKPWPRFHHKHGLKQNLRSSNWRMPSILFKVQDTINQESMIWQLKIRNCCLCDLRLNWMMQ